MFVTDNDEMLKKATQLWSFGETRTPRERRDYHAYALGWMYRMADLTAAFGRSQLTKLDKYQATLKENARALTAALKGTPNLILPTAYKGAGHNWYNYTIRFDMKALGHEQDASAFRDKLVAALNAEGVQTGVWQKFILPAMTVFQAKNAYGHGCPWSCAHAQKVSYDLRQYPMAQKHSDSHTGMTVPLRAPNGPKVAQLTARGIRKVMENTDQVR
jgi:dTDP-4-amino-4,6-dideoxygalactose transaminase